MLEATNTTLQRLTHFEFNSGLGRGLLRRYYKVGNLYPVTFGALRGIKLRYDGTLNFHSMLGLSDLRNFNILRKSLASSGILRPGMVVADVGANIGLYSLWSSRLLDKSGGGKIYSFEPNPAVAEVLALHFNVNNITNAEVIRLAVSDRVGMSEFHVSVNHATSSLLRGLAGENRGAASHAVPIELTTMDDFFLGNDRPAPDFIKMDIEGAAEMALKKCTGCIDAKRPLILIESHCVEEDLAIQSLILNKDYRAFRLSNLKWVKNPYATHPDPEGVWGNHILVPGEHFSKVRKVIG